MTYTLSLRTGRCVVAQHGHPPRVLPGKTLAWLRSEVVNCLALGLDVTFSITR